MRYLTVLAIALLPAPALAGKSEGDACAATLSPPAHQIYAASAPHVTATSDLRSVVRKQARGLVLSGEMTRQVAEDNAQSAGLCLQKLQS